MKPRSGALPLVFAALAGAALWLGLTALTGKREAWDASLYWVVAYPAGLLVSGWLGYAYPDRPWRWPLALFEAQALAMCLRDGELGSLWMLGLVLFAVLSLPAMLVARIAARMAVRSQQTT